tara:strand:+ start:250 stop:699 length:450 start_codon:yes stop_codon:yes gene_type:complete
MNVKAFGLKQKFKKRKSVKVCALSNTENNIQMLKQLNYEFLNLIETINSRCAMQGFVWGIGTRVMTHENFYQQIVIKNASDGYGVNIEHILLSVIIMALVSFGTTVSTLNYDSPIVNVALEMCPDGFTRDVEKINGRLAMIGFVLMCFV